MIYHLVSLCFIGNGFHCVVAILPFIGHANTDYGFFWWTRVHVSKCTLQVDVIKLFFGLLHSLIPDSDLVGSLGYYISAMVVLFWCSVIVRFMVLHSCCLSVVVLHSRLLDIIYMITGVFYWVILIVKLFGIRSFTPVILIVMWSLSGSLLPKLLMLSMELVVCWSEFWLVVSVASWFRSGVVIGGVSVNYIVIGMLSSLSSSHGFSNRSWKTKPVGNYLAINVIHWTASSSIGTIVKSFSLLSKASLVNKL